MKRNCLGSRVLCAAVGFAALAAVAETPFPKFGKPVALTSGPHEHLLASYFAIDFARAFNCTVPNPQ